MSLKANRLLADKPLQWSDVNDRFVVYAEGRGLGGWEHQEMGCRKGEGTLVSLATYEEDERLLTALISKGVPPALDAYWLGLNMCPDYDGEVWSDGSLWQHSRLPNVRPMLSSETCCIKAVWMPQQRNYNWLGEDCEALFPTVCEFHPQGEFLPSCPSGRVFAVLHMHRTSKFLRITRDISNYVPH